MGDTYKRSSIKKDLGLHYDILKNVAIPETVIEAAKTKMVNYNREIKKYAHATVKGKLMSEISKFDEKAQRTRLRKSPRFVKSALTFISNSAKQSDTYRDELARREQFKKIFMPIYKYLDELEEYFEGCKKINIIKKFNDKVKSDCEKLKQKGYFDINTIDNKQFEHFDKSKYNLSFVAHLSSPKSKIINRNPLAIEITPPLLIKRSNASETENYKSKCLQKFTNLRVVFSTYLSLINKIYISKYEQIPHIPPGTITKFINSRKLLDSALSKYEKCVKTVNDEVAKHKFYFYHGKNKDVTKNVSASIKETRAKLQAMISKAKRINLDAEFTTMTKGNDNHIYKSLMDSLESINHKINDIARYISKGNYDKFARDYEATVADLRELPQLVKNFQNASNFVQKDFSDQLAAYESSLESLTSNISRLQISMESFVKEFTQAYNDYVKTAADKSIQNTIKTILVIISIFVPFAGQISTIFDAWVNDINELTKSSIPVPKD